MSFTYSLFGLRAGSQVGQVVPRERQIRWNLEATEADRPGVRTVSPDTVLSCRR